MSEVSVQVTRVQVKGGTRGDARIAWVTIDNQRRLNCLTSAIVTGIEQTFLNLAEDAALRAVVLIGAGERAFIGGADRSLSLPVLTFGIRATHT